MLLSSLLWRYLSISQSTHCCCKHTSTTQRKRDNCNRYSQDLKRSQLSYRGRDRANQLVAVEVSVDFTEHTLLLSAHEHAQKDSEKETIVIVTDKLDSDVNCPIEDGIVPFSWLLLRYLSI